MDLAQIYSLINGSTPTPTTLPPGSVSYGGGLPALGAAADASMNPLLSILSGLTSAGIGANSINLPSFTKLPPQINQKPSWEPDWMVGDFSGPDLPTPGVGTAANSLMGVANPLVAIMHGIQQLDAANRGGPEEPTPTGLPPLPSFDQFQQQFGPEKEEPPLLSIPYDINSMPAPPALSAPPGADMDKVQSATRNNILGSMAQGAASVDPTSPGSFARALAAWGGAGARAAGESQRDEVELAHQDALNKYKVDVQNKENEYQHNMKKFELLLPNMKATDDTVVVSGFNKGKYEVRAVNTAGVLGNAKKLSEFTEAVSGDSLAADQMGTSYIVDSYQGDPEAQQTALLKDAIERTIRSGAGEAVFGEAYLKADETSKITNPGLMTKPAELRAEKARQITSKLLSNPEFMKDAGTWLKNAAPYSTSARLLYESGQHPHGQ